MNGALETQPDPGQSIRPPLLQVRDLTTRFTLARGSFNAVDHVSFALRRGEMLGIVGESGSGKSVLCLSLIGLLPPAAQTVRGQVLLDGDDLVAKRSEEMRRIRGRKIAMVLQDPSTALNPLFTIGNQVAESVAQRERPLAASRRVAVIEVLNAVHLPRPDRRLGSFPHQLSGGMKQRVAAAIALAAEAHLLIADEPTTALDVTIQAQFLGELKRLQEARGLSIILVTHDLGIVAAVCDHVCVMYSGRIVEQAPADRLFHAPRHPYTRGLIDCLPVLGRRLPELPTIEGEPASPLHRPSGCAYHPRCPLATARCRSETPPAVQIDDHHTSWCWEAGRVGAL